MCKPCNMMQHNHYKVTSDRKVADGSTETYTVGYHAIYKEACHSVITISSIIRDTPFRIYRWSTVDRNYQQESYYINGE